MDGTPPRQPDGPPVEVVDPEPGSAVVAGWAVVDGSDVSSVVDVVAWAVVVVVPVVVSPSSSPPPPATTAMSRTTRTTTTTAAAMALRGGPARVGPIELPSGSGSPSPSSS
jgi:hypothetical protein